MMTAAQLDSQLHQIKKAARELRAAPTAKKNAALLIAREKLLERQSEVLNANQQDLHDLATETSPAFRDRLTLESGRIAAMSESLSQVAALPDPVGEVVEKKTLSNGLRVSRVRAPLGVVFMIFESRPNVAVEAFSLALKAGNGVILRGGKESRKTVEVIYAILRDSLQEAGLPVDCLWGITDPDRALITTLLGKPNAIDVVVPRGGEKLIAFVTENSKIPIIKNDRGMCHVYVHEDADLEMAASIVENAKTQRPGVCNAMETLLVHESVAPTFLPKLRVRLQQVQWFGCERTREILQGDPQVKPASQESWDTEYLDLKMNCRVVKSVNDAIDHIDRHGSKHSESIITRSEPIARLFQAEIDAAAVYWNASTRFTDGFELGLGGELGISTQKLHARGPVGLRELTSVRWLMDGSGQVRK